MKLKIKCSDCKKKILLSDFFNTIVISVIWSCVIAFIGYFLFFFMLDVQSVDIKNNYVIVDYQDNLSNNFYQNILLLEINDSLFYIYNKSFHIKRDYDCKNFSKDLRDDLEKKNISSSL
jgi:hypothetical protein